MGLKDILTGSLLLGLIAAIGRWVYVFRRERITQSKERVDNALEKNKLDIAGASLDELISEDNFRRRERSSKDPKGNN